MVLVEGWLDHLYIDPFDQGLGVGSAFLDLAKTESPDGIELWTFAANSGARRFYERHGFLAVDRTDGDNEEGAPDIRYHWRPTEADRSLREDLPGSPGSVAASPSEVDGLLGG
jgi:hypothetical protein